MSNQQEPPARREGDIYQQGTIKEVQNVTIGAGSSIHITGNVSQSVSSSIDLPALRSSLLELYELLGATSLPLKQKMALQLAIGRAAELAERDETEAEALAEGVRQIGETFERTGEAVEAGSQVGRTILKIVGIVGPLVAGGARVVASWFGLPLP
jgi:hypothetical protein